MTTDIRSPRPNRAVILLMFAGLAAMFVWTFVYRANNPSMVAAMEQQGGKFGMGQGEENAGAMGAVMQAMQRLKANPEDPAALKQAAEAFAMAEMWDKALPMLEKAQAAEPKDLDLLNLLGVAYFRMERPQDSAKQFAAMLQIVPDDFHAQYNLGAVYKHGLNDMGKAKTYFEAVIANPTADPQTKEQARQELAEGK